MEGGYDDGYKACDCFWGRSPGSLILKLAEQVPDMREMTALDVGCGEGKNALFLARHGATVRAMDISDRAIDHARRESENIQNVAWESNDAMEVDLGTEKFDIVVAYGVFHCLRSPNTIETLVRRMQNATRVGGWFVACSFNRRHQELKAHPGFHPCLIDHADYISLFELWNIQHQSDLDLHETHPHNLIPHTHSMTRILARKVQS